MLLAAAAMLPAIAAAQSNSAAPQTIPGLDRFSLPPKPTPTPAPPPSGPIVAPLARPTPASTPAASATTAPVKPPPVTTTASGSAVRTPAPTPLPARTPSAPDATPSPAAPPVPSESATPGTVATPAPVASAAAQPAPVPVEQPASSGSSGLLIAGGVALLALLAAGWVLFRRRPHTQELEDIAYEPVAAPVPLPVRIPPPPPPPPPAPKPSGLLTVPLRRAPEPPPPSLPVSGLLTVPAPRPTRPGIDRLEPEIEILLLPQSAGTDDAMGAAVDYRMVIRNVGQGDARDIRFGIFILTSSARQAADLQMIFATDVANPVVPPFELKVGTQVELSGTATLPRENVNVMTIEGKPWFVPVMAMKAEYRWGENVGAPGMATAAHMIGINRGEGAKMGPFRLDAGPRMHPRVAERKVA